MAEITKAPSTQESEDTRPTIDEKFKEYLKGLSFEEHYIDRDGDLFRVICPECESKNHYYVGGGFFICARKHIFHAYTEDGVRKESELQDKKRVLGDDLQKDGKDSHGHMDYEFFEKDEKIPCFFEFYFGYDDDAPEQTFDKAKEYIEYLKTKLNEYAEQFQRFYLPYFYFFVDINDAAAGKPSSDLKTFPEDMWIQKFILIKEYMNEINKLFPENSSTGYSLTYTAKRA